RCHGAAGSRSRAQSIMTTTPVGSPSASARAQTASCAGRCRKPATDERSIAVAAERGAEDVEQKEARRDRQYRAVAKEPVARRRVPREQPDLPYDPVHESSSVRVDVWASVVTSAPRSRTACRPVSRSTGAAARGADHRSARSVAARPRCPTACGTHRRWGKMASARRPVQTTSSRGGIRMTGMRRALGGPCVVRTVLAAAILSISVRGARAQTLTDPTLTVTALSTAGLSVPTSMAFLAPDDILVLEKNTGQVRRVLGGVLQPGNVLDVHVANFGERGMLGIAINTESPPRVFLYYTEASGMDRGPPLGNRVYRYTVKT